MCFAKIKSHYKSEVCPVTHVRIKNIFINLCSDTSNNSNMDHPYSKPFSAGPGSKVHLLVNSKRVGVGTTTGINLLHGHEIPPEYAAVSIEKIDPNICPMYTTSFDEPFLHVGQFTAWPIAQLQIHTTDIDI